MKRFSLCLLIIFWWSAARIVGADTPPPPETGAASPTPSVETTPVPSVAPIESAATETVAPSLPPPDAPTVASTPKVDPPSPSPIQDKQFRHDFGSNGDAVVEIMGNAEATYPVREAVVAVMGNSHAHENVGQSVVAVMGNATADQEVGGDLVAVMGNAYANGHVHGQVVAVLGRVELGPDAVVDGQVVSVGGRVVRSPTAVVHGVNQVAFLSKLPHIELFVGWLQASLFRGRLLSFDPAASFLWFIAAGFFAFYLLLAAMFPGTLTRCSETLEQRPGRTLLTGILWMIVCLPLTVLMLVLTPTVVPPLVFFVGTISLKLVGKAAFLNWLGRRFIRKPTMGGVMSSVAIGGVILSLLYCVPILGLIIWKVAGVIAFGMAFYTLILWHRGQKATRVAENAGASAPPLSAMSVAQSATDFSVPPPIAPFPTSGATALPPTEISPVSSAVPRAAVVGSSILYPRAGFGIRLAASLLDWILVGVFVESLHIKGYSLLFFTIYCLSMWALKGTTVGGIICGLKVVRLDDRPMDWMIALVRTLGAFLSAAVFFLGFIWVAFDDQAQSWHDRIAGTTIVRLPKGTPLI